MRPVVLQLRAILAAALILPLQGCAAPARLNAVPAEVTTKATIPTLSGIRYVMPDNADDLFRDAFASASAELKTLIESGWSGGLPPVSFLAVSGGGDDGAFGAGILCGWTETGTRPEFKLVTGISTGALIAPFAFLGPKCCCARTRIEVSGLFPAFALLCAVAG